MFKSGNADHPGDRFVNTSVEVLPVEIHKEGFTGYTTLADGFITLTKFDEQTGKIVT